MSKRKANKPKKNTTSKDGNNKNTSTTNANQRNDGAGQCKPVRNTCWTRIERGLNVLAAATTVAAFIIAVVQFTTGNWQFDRSGPQFSWFEPNRYTREISSDGSSHQLGSIVISNTGRTPDTIIAMKRTGAREQPMRLCTADFDANGDFDTHTGKVHIGTGMMPLQPGDSRIVFVVTGNGGQLDQTTSLEIYTASGRTMTTKPIDNVSSYVQDYYGNLPGMFNAQNACLRALEPQD